MLLVAIFHTYNARKEEDDNVIIVFFAVKKKKGKRRKEEEKGAYLKALTSTPIVFALLLPPR
jgi:hypothetical protein